MPRDLFQLILDDPIPVSCEAYAVLASMLKSEHPEGW
jgi:hypothetical protein